jgi:hypothetical protein
MDYYLGQIQERFYKLEWNRTYDFLEFIISSDNYDQRRNNLVWQLNQVFDEEKIPYKIIDGQVTPLISEEELEEIDTALNSKYDLVSNHLRRALEYYKKRPEADYKNSIKESVSAVEALAKILLNNPQGTLGKLADDLNIHSALKEAIKKIYGWTSDEGGIRHSEKNGQKSVDIAEARYMLVHCSALVNFLISKYEN